MDQGKSLDFQIQECLTRLGIASPVEWDVLAFVYRHQASLTNADQIARMLGYPSTVGVCDIEVGNQAARRASQ